MTKQKLFLYLLLLVGIVQSAMAQEPYAVLSDDNTVLTFYYDTQKAARGGMSVGPFGHQSTRSWQPQRETIATVVFDASFADCTSLASTAYWFHGCTNLDTISGIENLKTDNVTDMSYMFSYCSSLTSLDVSGFKTGKVTNMGDMFHGCSNLTSLDLSSFKTDNVTNMRSMFSGCSRLTSLYLSNFKTDNVTEMQSMFNGCSGLTSLDLSSFKTDNVTYMGSMFSGCSRLKTIYASRNWSTEKVTSGSYMFTDCTILVGGEGTAYDASHTDHTYARIDGGTTAPGYFTMTKVMPYAVLSNDNTVLTFYYDAQKAERGGMSVGPFEDDSEKSWYPQRGTIATVVFDASFANCTSLTSTAYWFHGCTNLNTISGIENLKTENVTDMNSMFSDCGSLTSLDLSGFKTDNVTDMTHMFYDCSSLTTIYASNNWSTIKVTKGEDMFTNCTNLVGGRGTVYDENHTDHTYARIDGGTAAPGYFTEKAMTLEPYAVLSNDNTVLTFYYDAQKAARGGISVGPFESTPSWYPQRETIATVVFDASFADCTSLTSTAYWFYECTKLNTISGIENLKTENVTNMRAMFHNCSSLTSLDLSGFKTENVTNMNGMFYNCSSLTRLDLSSFKTDNVTIMRYMFYRCKSLTSLDLSGFKTDKVMDMTWMFGNCSSLTTIYASKNWSTEKVTSGSYMFYSSTKLVGGQGTAYDASHTDHTYARIDGGTAAPGYFTEKSGTGIRGLNADSNADNAPVYDLSGRRVQVPAKGIYVKNGKKFVNK